MKNIHAAQGNSKTSEEQKEKVRLAVIKASSKEVTQYNREGIKIKTWPSATEAYRETGIDITLIGKAAG